MACVEGRRGTVGDFRSVRALKKVRGSAIVLLLCGAAGVSFSAWADQAQSPPLTPLSDDGIHDPANPAIVRLQDPKESMAAFPKDRRGEVDWVRTLRSGMISPRRSVDGDEYGGGEVHQEMDMDILFTNTKQMPNVRFPHLAHTEWLACSNCHPAIFVPQRGANAISMEKILKGEFCGRCHDKVSFSLFVCERCHSVPHEGSPSAWWK